MIGTTPAHFEIKAKLGEGGMGEVWLADDTKLRPDGTVKVLDFGLAKTWDTEGRDGALSMSPARASFKLSPQSCRHRSGTGRLLVKLPRRQDVSPFRRK